MNYEIVISKIKEKYQSILKDNLIGIYIHGSVAFNCFNWDKSDIDFIIVIRDKLSINNKLKIMEETIKINESINEIYDIPNPEDNKWHHYTIISEDGSFFARSNPFGPALIDEYKLYCGEIHTHTDMCDGTNSPQYIYEYGRKAAGLDFCAVSSHDFHLAAEK